MEDRSRSLNLAWVSVSKRENVVELEKARQNHPFHNMIHFSYVGDGFRREEKAFLLAMFTKTIQSI